MKTAIESLKIVILMAFIVLTVPTYKLLTEIRATVVEARRATKSIADYAAVQTEQLRSPRNVRALELGIAAAATAQVAFQEINRHTLPKINRTLDSLDHAVLSLDAMIVNTDREISQRLLPAATVDLEEAGKRISELEGLADKVGISLDTIHNLLANGDLELTAKSLAASSKNIELATHQLRLASESAPGTARAIEDISKTSAKWRKWILSSQVFSAIGRAVF